MRANLFSNFLQGTASATERAIRDLNPEGKLARLLCYGEEFVDLVLGLDYLKEVNDATEMAMVTKLDNVISNEANATTSNEAIDLHDVTGHHRYYGSAA